MSAVLEFPAIAADAETMSADPQDIADISNGKAIVKLTATEAGLSVLRADLAGKTYDLTTTKGDKDARADRKRCVDLRSALEKKRKELKAPALEFGRLIDAEAKRITDAVLALEAPIDAAIKADEERREAERQERARIEAERIAALHAQVDANLSGWLERCREPGMTAERIAKGIVMFKMLTVPAGLDEVADYWTTQFAITLGRMEAMHADCQRQEELARIAAEREEQRRQAEQLAKERAELERQAAALRAEQERIERERVEAERRAAAEVEARVRAEQETQARRERDAAEADRLRQQKEFTEGQDAQQVLKAEPATADATDRAVPANTSPVGGPMGAGQPAAAGPAAGEQEPAATVEQPMLTLGQINTRLDPIRITGEGLCALGFQPSGRQRAAVLYLESEWTAIKSAIVNHINSLKD